MKRVGFYRRVGQAGPNAGLKEKIVWQLSKRPMTPTELAQILGAERYRVVDNIRDMVKDSGVAKVSKGAEVMRENGTVEHLYHYDGPGDRIFPKAGKPMLVSGRSAMRTDPKVREEHLEKAKRRARLIKAGLYIDEMG